MIFSSGARNLIAGFVDHNGYFIEELQGSGNEAVEEPEGLPVYARDLNHYDRATRQTTLISHLPGLPNEGAQGREPVIARLTADTASVFYTSLGRLIP